MSSQHTAAGQQGRDGRGAAATVRRSAVAVALTMVAVSAAAGAPGSGMTAALVLGAVRSAAVGRAAVAPSPRVSGTMSTRVEARLERGFALAAQQLETRPACREMFARLGRDGMSQLSTTLYYQASPERERGICRRALASTHVGSPATSLCRRFDTVSDGEAAMVVLHEALHWSGLSERPVDPDGMSANDINEMVRDACGL